MWTCPNCGEQVENQFDVCWQCGTSSDGTRDEGFVTDTTDQGRALFVRLGIAALTLAIGVPAFAADITFFAYSDCHYGAPGGGDRPVQRRPHVEWINSLPGTSWPDVVLLMVGHQGGGVDNVWRGINWASSNGVLEAFRITPDNVLTGVSRKDSEWGRPMRKKIYLSYETSALPAVVNNGNWASNVSHHSATLSGKILYQAVPETEVTVYWGTEDGGDTPDDWKYSKAIGVEKPGEPFSVDITGLKPWTEYHYRCRVSNGEGEAWAAASIPFTTRGLLPENWETTFVGYEQRPWGGAHLKNGVLTVRGSGRDIGERGQRIDNFQYAFTGAEGNVEIQARLTGMEGRTRDPKASVMLRENVENGAKSVSLLFSERDGLRLFTRGETDRQTEISAAVKDDSPRWLKLVRSGDTFTGYTSDDGQQWTQVGDPVTVEMAPKATAGLAVTAGNRDGSRHQTATFDRVEVQRSKLARP